MNAAVVIGGFAALDAALIAQGARALRDYRDDSTQVDESGRHWRSRPEGADHFIVAWKDCALVMRTDTIRAGTPGEAAARAAADHGSGPTYWVMSRDDPATVLGRFDVHAGAALQFGGEN